MAPGIEPPRRILSKILLRIVIIVLWFLLTSDEGLFAAAKATKLSIKSPRTLWKRGWLDLLIIFWLALTYVDNFISLNSYSRCACLGSAAFDCRSIITIRICYDRWWAYYDDGHIYHRESRSVILDLSRNKSKQRENVRFRGGLRPYDVIVGTSQ